MPYRECRAVGAVGTDSRKKTPESEDSTLKKLFALLLLFALPCSLFACGSTEPPSLPEGMQIAEQGDGYTF